MPMNWYIPVFSKKSRKLTVAKEKFKLKRKLTTEKQQY